MLRNQPVSSGDAPPELIEGARAGHPGAVEELLRLMWPQGYAIAYSVMRDARLAEDVAQEASAMIFRSISQLRSRGAFRVWFYRIVLREALRAERERQREMRNTEPRDAISEGPSPDLKMDVLHALAALGRAQRAAVILHFYAGLTSAEIGAILGIPDSSVRFHIMRAKRALVPMLGDYAISRWEQYDAI